MVAGPGSLECTKASPASAPQPATRACKEASMTIDRGRGQVRDADGSGGQLQLLELEVLVLVVETAQLGAEVVIQQRDFQPSS